MTTNLNTVSLGYIGQRRSALTGNYLLGNGYRSFNPIIRRFSAWDSLSPFGSGGPHGYGYCAGDPVNQSDASGQGPFLDLLIGLGLAIGRNLRRADAAEVAAEVGEEAASMGSTASDVADAAGEVEAADMDFIGYHGTSEASALNILDVGINEQFLPRAGQIGRGFYIARMNGTLPQWGAEIAANFPSARQSWATRAVSRLIGEARNPLIDNANRRSILKIYTVRPLRNCKWNIMNPGDLAALKATNYDNGGPGLDSPRDAKWLQMVIPPDQFRYLRVRRDDGIFERPHNWLSHVCEYSVRSARLPRRASI